jgi:glycosyltransferase involved in cell wall biosynthesis
MIPHLNQPDRLEACLRSLEAQTLSRPLFEIIVIDNGPAAPPHEVVARHAGVRPNRARGPARNTGAGSATDANYLEALLKA